MSTQKDELKTKLETVYKKRQVQAVFWQYSKASPKRQMKVMVNLDQIDGFALDNDSIETRKQRLIAAARAQSTKPSVKFSEDISTIGSENKILQEKNDALSVLNKMKALSIQLTPALRKMRGRSRTTDDIREKKPKLRASTPHPNSR